LFVSLSASYQLFLPTSPTLISLKEIAVYVPEMPEQPNLLPACWLDELPAFVCGMVLIEKEWYFD
jgi:hypothetical protein